MAGSAYLWPQQLPAEINGYKPFGTNNLLSGPESLVTCPGDRFNVPISWGPTGRN